MVIQVGAEQLKILQPYTFENYITELVVHCDECFPQLKKTMGEENLRQALKDAFVKAKGSGFTQRGPVQFYIDLLVAFGYGFETDPQYYWIQASLKKNRNFPQIERSSLLYDHIKRYSIFTIGEENKYLLQTAEKLNDLSIHNVKIHKDSFNADIHYLIEYIYPEKYELIGKEAIEKLIEEGVKKAQIDYQFSKPNPIALIIVLMFLLGHQFDNDPFCSWASRETTTKKTDENMMRTESNVIANRLEKRAKIWLAATLKNEHIALDNASLLN